MDRDKFFSLMESLANAYTDDRLMNDKVIATWFKYLNQYPIEVLTDAVDVWIKSNERKPAISDLRKQCEILPSENPEKYAKVRRLQ